jgi:hypothetical protein
VNSGRRSRGRFSTPGHRARCGVGGISREVDDFLIDRVRLKDEGVVIRSDNGGEVRPIPLLQNGCEGDGGGISPKLSAEGG